MKKGPTRDEIRRERMAKAHQIEQGRRAAALHQLAELTAQTQIHGLNQIQRRWLESELKSWTAEAKSLGASDVDIRIARTRNA